MGIENPTTYGDHYWKKQVEAQKKFNDDAEKAFAPFIAGMLKDIPDIPEMPAGFQNMINALTDPPDFAFLPYLIGVGINLIDEVLDAAFKPDIMALARIQRRNKRTQWLTSVEVNTLWLRQKIPEGLWDEVIASEGYEDVLGSALFESQSPYPSVPDFILYSRYHGDADEPIDEFRNWYNISPRDWKAWKWLSQQRLTTLEIQTLFRRNVIEENELFGRLAEVGWPKETRDYIEELGWTIPNAMLLVQGGLQQQYDIGDILRDISIADIHPKYADLYLDAILTKPASQDLIAYELRQDPSLSNLPTQLRKIGIHPDYYKIYQELAYQIPPVADIITMAVREAFTPEIARKFGQYEDYPKDLEMWGEKKGLSKEWTERYWAAHWSLPSTQQGFEMLHRGLIDNNELDMLLRALDVMPFWRKKLTGIAFRRLSRVDIRRMYKVGVLDERQVLESYLELGYNDRDAERMSDFTVRQVLATQSKFTSGDILSAYSNYMITRTETKELLLLVEVKQENIEFILSTADYKREWSLTNAKISAIRNLYKKETYDDSKARGELLKLDLPAERVDVLMMQWFIDEKDKPARLWTTAQTLSFIEKELITKERGIQELITIGYDTEHINIYMSDMA